MEKHMTGAYPYLHYRAEAYFNGRKTSEKMLNSLPKGAIKDLRQISITQAVQEAKEALLRQAQAKLQKVSDEVLKEMSNTYTAFVFKNYSDENGKQNEALKQKYNEAIINNFQKMFTNSNFINNTQLISSGLDSIDFQMFLPKKAQGLIDEKKGISIDNFGNFYNQILNLFNNMQRILGKNSTNLADITKAKNDITKLKTAIGQEESKYFKGKNEGVWLQNKKLEDELSNIINDYNNLITKVKLSSTTAEQGDVGELVIAAIQYYINKGTINGTKKILNDFNKQTLQWTGKDKIKNAAFVPDKNIFNLGDLNRLFHSGDLSTFSVFTDSINMGESQSTADIKITWDDLQLKDIGASVKNYRHGLNSKQIHILDEANLLSILDLTTESYFAHFMHLTSRLHYGFPNRTEDAAREITKEAKTVPINKIAGWGQMKTVLKMATLIRGLAGIRSGKLNGGEAPILILIDSSKRRVHLFSTLKIIEKVIHSGKANGIKGGDIKRPIYENEWVGFGAGNWYDAKYRAALWLVAARKQTLSCSINPKLLI